MKHKTLFAITILALTIYSCTNEIDYKNEYIKPKLTINGFINTDSSTNVIYLNYTGKSEPLYAENTTLDIYINDEFKEKAIEIPSIQENDKQKRYLVKSKFKSKDKVRVEASSKDGEYMAWAEETVPQSTAVLDIDTMDIPLSANDMYSVYKKLRVKIKFKDIPNQKNYYRIVLEQRKEHRGVTFEGKDTIAYETDTWLWSWEDLVLTDGKPVSISELENDLFERINNRYGVFDDSMFTDNEYTLNVQSWFYDYYRQYNFTRQSLDVYLAVRLLSITESEYRLLKTLNYLDSYIYDEFLNDPVKIPSNVRNGTGTVGFSSEDGVVMHVIKNMKYFYED